MDSEWLRLTSGFVALAMSLGNYMKNNPKSFPIITNCPHAIKSRPNNETYELPKKPIRSVSKSFSAKNPVVDKNLEATTVNKKPSKNVSKSFLSSTRRMSQPPIEQGYSPLETSLGTTTVRYMIN